MVFIWTGLVKNRSIPELNASRWTSACATPVRATIVARLCFPVPFSKARIRRVDSSPSMIGMEISAKKSVNTYDQYINLEFATAICSLLH